MRIGFRVVLVATVLLLVLGLEGGLRPARDDGRPTTPDPGAASADDPPATEPTSPRRLRRTAREEPRTPPSIVVVLMDDVSTDLVQTMAQAADMARAGASYEHSYVVDSLCCVSRSSLLTGQYPHQTGVRTNTANTPNLIGPLGGWEAFTSYGNGERSVNVRLQEAGYTTGYVGKFLNQYAPTTGSVDAPPGWDDWQAVLASAYDGWGFEVTGTTDDGVAVVEEVPAPPETATEEEKDEAYVGNVIADRAVSFVREHRAAEDPYLLVVAPYAAHSRVSPVPAYADDPWFPPAFADRPAAAGPGRCGALPCRELTTDDLPGFGDDQADNAPLREDGTPAPQWRSPVTTSSANGATRALRDRARMVQSVDRMVRRLRKVVGPDTYVVLTSDNGFHLGQHGLGQGKGTPFVSDVRVPLLVTGPGVVPGTRREVVSNLDLAPTLEDLAGLRRAPFRSGTSLVPTFRDAQLSRRHFTFFEHTWAPSLGADPDAMYAGGTMDLIPSYVAVRTRTGLLVRFDLDPDWEGEDHAFEFYSYGDVGWERTNGYGEPRHRGEIALLTKRLEQFDRCATVTAGADVVPRWCRRLTQ